MGRTIEDKDEGTESRGTIAGFGVQSKLQPHKPGPTKPDRAGAISHWQWLGMPGHGKGQVGTAGIAGLAVG